MAEQPTTRRERYREQTIAEVKQIAMEQLAEAGAAGISLNAIAKRMGVTGPALYRYFAGRDALLTELIADGYRDLADTVECGVGATGRPVATRLRAASRTFREWAVANPHRYLLLFGTPVPGYEAPQHTTAAASSAMAALLSVFDDTAPADTPPGRSALTRQLASWGKGFAGERYTPVQLGWGLRWWTRLHGLLSLEVAGQFSTMGIEPELLFTAEVEALIAELP